jgi:hypothetical protein
MPPVDPNISPEALKSLDDFKKRMEEINDQIVDMGNELGDDLVKKLTKVTISAKKITDPLKEVESLSKKISGIAEETAVLRNQEAILSRNYVKALQDGNKEEQRKLLKKLDQVRSNIDLNQQLLAEFQTLKEVSDVEAEILRTQQEQVKAEEEKAKARKDAAEALKQQLQKAWLPIKGAILGIVKAVLAVDTQVTNLGRSLGISNSSAKGLRDEMESFAKGANDGFTTVAKLAKAQADLTDQLGIAVDFGNEERQQFSKLTEVVGLTADEAGKLASFSASTGMSTEDYLKDVRAAGFASQQANKIHISDKQLLQSISKLSAGILVKFQGNPKALADAVVQAKKFGLTLEQVNKTGDALLDWESSIENELKAELITGKQINLERARAAALTGDQATLMQEVASQAGSLEEFSSMNVIAQRSLAEAFGMNSDEMAEMLMKQEAINKYGQAAEELNAQQLKDFEKQGGSLADFLAKEAEKVDIQTRFNTAMERMQEILGNIAAGPLGTILGMFADLLSNSTSLAAILGGVMMVNLAKMAVTLKRLAKASKSGAIVDIIGAAFKSVGGIPGIGMIAAGAAAAAGLAYLASKTQDVEDGMVPPGNGPFTITDKFGATAITAAGDGIAVSPNISKSDGTLAPSNANKNDSLSISPSINKGNSGGIDIAPLVAAMNEVKNAINALANKPAPAMALQVGAEKLGEVVGKQAETGTNQYKNAYRLA